MAFFYVTEPRRPYYRPPPRWTWGMEYDPFDLFSEFVGHHPTTLMGFPTLTFQGMTPANVPPERKEEKKWHKIVKLAPYFGPDDLTVKTEGNALVIRAVHEEKGEDGDIDRCEMTRKVEVPEPVDMDTVKTLWLKRGGVLVVGHLKKAAEEEKPEAVKHAAEEKPKKEAKPETTEPKGGEAAKGTPKRQLSIDPENFSSEMRSFAQDVHEALFGESIPKPDPDQVIPMEYESAAKDSKEGDTTDVVQSQDSEEIKLDVTGYKPEEVKVSVDGNTINVQAQHEHSDDDHLAVYQFERSFTLPKGVIASKVTSKIDKEKNTLVISIPKEKLAIENKAT